MSAPQLTTLKETYAGLWKRMTILPDRQANCVSRAHVALAAKERYQTVADKLGLPKATGWVFIACTHYRESNLNFHCHLHNGDPLTARTTHVPAGRPLAPAQPPFTWEESALDALQMRGLHELASQLCTLEGFAFACEGYNGWGYFWHDHVSSYLWAGTTVSEKGKYVRDGVYDPDVVDPQMGTMALLQALMAIDPSIQFGASVVAPAAPPATAPAPVPAPTQAPEKGSWLHTVALLFSTLTGMVSALSQTIDALRPYLAHPAVVGAIVAALAAAGIVIWREHHARAPA